MTLTDLLALLGGKLDVAATFAVCFFLALVTNARGYWMARAHVDAIIKRFEDRATRQDEAYKAALAEQRRLYEAAIAERDERIERLEEETRRWWPLFDRIFNNLVDQGRTTRPPR